MNNPSSGSNAGASDLALPELVARLASLREMSTLADANDCDGAAILIDDLVHLIQVADEARRCAAERLHALTPILAALADGHGEELSPVMNRWSAQRAREGQPSLFAGTFDEQGVEKEWTLSRLVRCIRPWMRSDENVVQTAERCLRELHNLSWRVEHPEDAVPVAGSAGLPMAMAGK
jgi:hypothetical protein